MAEKRINADGGDNARVYVSNELLAQRPSDETAPREREAHEIPDWFSYQLRQALNNSRPLGNLQSNQGWFGSLGEARTLVIDGGLRRRYQTTLNLGSPWFVKLFSESFATENRPLSLRDGERTILRLDDKHLRPDLVGADLGYRTRKGLQIFMGPRLFFQNDRLSPGFGVGIEYYF